MPPPGRRQPLDPSVGSSRNRIVAETFLGMLFGDGSSYLALDPLWAPNGGDFRLMDLVSYALGGKVVFAYR